MAKIEIRDEFVAAEVRELKFDIGFANLLVREHFDFWKGWNIPQRKDR